MRSNTDIISLLFRGRVTQSDLDSLCGLIKNHLKKFNDAYAGYSRPKHHAALHVPDMIAKYQKCLDCEKHEAKHKCYKSFLAQRFYGQLGDDAVWHRSCLIRIAESQVQRLATSGLPTCNLVSNPKRVVLQNAVLHLNAVIWLPSTQQCLRIRALRDGPIADCDVLRMHSVNRSSVSFLRTGQRIPLSFEPLSEVEVPPLWFEAEDAAEVLVLR